MHAFKRCFGVITTPNTGLVGRYGDGPASFAQTRYCIDGTRYGNPLIQCLDVGVGVLIDDAVAVENDQFHKSPAASFKLRAASRPVLHRLACPNSLPGLSQQGNIGDTEEKPAQTCQQSITVGFYRRVVGVNQHLIKEGIYRLAQCR